MDVAVFCLALMGTDYPSFLREAARVLKPHGIIWIAEVRLTSAAPACVMPVSRACAQHGCRRRWEHPQHIHGTAQQLTQGSGHLTRLAASPVFWREDWSRLSHLNDELVRVLLS